VEAVESRAAEDHVVCTFERTTSKVMGSSW
jgi:hypothetical protein